MEGSAPRDDPGIRVLYVAGLPNSGTTILSNILGEVPGLFSAGELHYFWRRGLVENRPCSCGEMFADCPVWSEVVRAAGVIEPGEAERLAGMLERYLLLRRLPRFVLARRDAGRGSPELAEYARLVERLYRAIRDVTGCRVIVDSSKVPTYGYLLGSLPGIDLRVVHIVRDARAIAYSWVVRRGRRSTRALVDAALAWNAWNVCAEAFWGRRPDRYVRVRYEDFAARPIQTLERILGLLGEPAAGLPFVGPRRVALGTHHTFAGNRTSRFSVGHVDVKADAEWTTGMAARDRRAVTAFASPLLARYGYFRRRGSSPPRRKSHV